MHAILTFDDAVSNHATRVAPLLREHGFGATFFVAEYPGPGDGTDRFETDKLQYMTWAQIRSLSEAGFEVGNHTGSHSIMRGLDDAAMSAEIDLIEVRCQTHRIPHSQSFAYPCGEYDKAAMDILRRRGYRAARTTEARPWDPSTDDPFAIPSFVITDSAPEDFAVGLKTTITASASSGRPHVAVFTFHGVPDHNHPWVTFSPSNFREALQMLRVGNWQVTSLFAAVGLYSAEAESCRVP
jgi:peptidoglycan-N-acetylglucosamine deacetylase